MFTFSARPSFLSLATLFCLFATTSPLAARAQQLPPDPASQIAQRRQADRVVDTPDRDTPDGTSPVLLPGHIPAWATPGADAGAVPNAQTVQLILTLSRAPQLQAAFQQLLDDQQNPSSPGFHRWLTPQQIGEQYGPTQHDLDALTSWLTAQGFAVESVTPSRTFVQVSAPASTVASVLHTGLHLFHSPAGTFQAPTSEPSLPASLRPIVSFITGLAVVPYHTHSTAIADAPHPVSPPASPSLLHPGYTNGSGGRHFLLPGDFAAIYHLQPVYNTGTSGAQSVTILGGSRLDPTDVANYEGISGLPSYNPTIIVPPNFTDPGYSTNDQTEGMLDFERVYGTATGASVHMLIAKNWLDGITTQKLLLYAINTLNDPIMSLSFGACENLQTPSFVQSEDSMYSQAAAQGMSVFVSSGDNGVAGCNGLTTAPTAYPSINDICATGYVTCVGGTQFSDQANPAAFWSPTNGPGLVSALGYIPEGAWNEPVNASGVFQSNSGGGGFSVVIPKPAWQTGIGVPADGHRDVPDVSFSSSGQNGYVVCQNAYHNDGCSPNFAIVGGTSAAAPAMAGIAALLNDALHGRQGNLNPLLYRLAATAPNAFHDATPASSGVTSCSTATPSTCNNTVPTTTTALQPSVPGYGLTPGYDLATGLGSLDVSALFLAAATPTLPAVNALTYTLTPGPSGPSLALTSSVAPSSGSGVPPTGSVQFFLDGATFGPATPLVASKATFSAPLPSAGTHTVSSVYSGDTVYSAATSSTLSLTAAALNSGITLNLSPTTIAVTHPANVSFFVTGSAGGPSPTGSVSLFVNSSNFGPGPLVNGMVSGSFVPPSPGTYQIYGVYSGDAVYAPSTSSTAVLTVLTAPGFSIQSSPASLSFAAGALSGNTSTLTYTSLAAFAGLVAPSCTISFSGGIAVAPPTCTFSSASINVPAGGIGTTVLTVATSAATTSALLRPSAIPASHLSRNKNRALGEATLACLLLLLLPGRRRRLLRQAQTLSIFLVLSAALFTVAGCGGKTATSSPTLIPGTSRGLYTVTVTGLNGTTTSTLSIPLTIQ